MIVMAHPLSASSITMFALLDNSLRDLCRCIGRLRLTLIYITLRKPALRLLPLAFLRVVVFVTTGVGVVIRVISYSSNSSGIVKSCVESTRCDPKNVKALFLYRRCGL